MLMKQNFNKSQKSISKKKISQFIIKTYYEKYSNSSISY